MNFKNMFAVKKSAETQTEPEEAFEPVVDNEDTEESDEEGLTDEEIDELMDKLNKSDMKTLQVAQNGWTTTDVVHFGKESRTIILSGEIDEDVATGICSQLSELNTDSQEPIVIYLNTPGGSIVDALAIYDMMKVIDSPIACIVNGGCMSAGLIILSAADLRLSTPMSLFFYHQPVMYPRELASTETVDSTIRMYKWSQKKMDTIIRKRASISNKKWLRDFKDKTSMYFSAEEAIKYGILDDIIPYANKKELVLAKE